MKYQAVIDTVDAYRRRFRREMDGITEPVVLKVRDARGTPIGLAELQHVKGKGLLAMVDEDVHTAVRLGGFLRPFYQVKRDGAIVLRHLFVSRT
jgi:hypothetical protein